MTTVVCTAIPTSTYATRTFRRPATPTYRFTTDARQVLSHTLAAAISSIIQRWRPGNASENCCHALAIGVVSHHTSSHRGGSTITISQAIAAPTPAEMSFAPTMTAQVVGRVDRNGDIDESADVTIGLDAELPVKPASATGATQIVMNVITVNSALRCPTTLATNITNNMTSSVAAGRSIPPRPVSSQTCACSGERNG